MNLGPYRRGALSGCAVIALLAFCAPVSAYAQEAAYSFNIPAQDLGVALRAYARAARQQVVFDSAALRGRRSMALVGSYTAGEGLRRLLADSGLESRRTPAGVIYVEAVGPQAEGARSEPEPATAVEELIVTAEKREANIQTVPVSISAIKGDKMTSLGLTRLTDYAQYVPGLIVGDGGAPGFASVSLRGIVPFGLGSIIGYYIDDTPLGSSGNFAGASITALDLMPYDLERLEVLRGPQGTLYGSGSMGGLLKYTLKPADTGRFTAQAGAELDSTANSSGVGYGLRGAVNVPVVQDRLAIRVSGYDQEYRGYVDDVRLGQGDINDGRQYGGRVAATWKPADNLRVNLNAMFNRTRFDDLGVVQLGNVTTYLKDGITVATGTPAYGDFGQANPYAQPLDKSLDYYSGTINWDLGSLSAVAATSYSSARLDGVQDISNTYGAYTALIGQPAGTAYEDFFTTTRKFTQEFRLVSPTGGRVEWLAGAFYSHEKSNLSETVHINDANRQPISGPFAPYFNPYFIHADAPSMFEEYAAFGDLTFHLTDRFDLTGGLRYAHNDQSFEETEASPLVLGPAPVHIGGSSAESVATWQANARYRFTDQVMAYARVATGYRPGGPNARGAAVGVPSQVGSDSLTSYEAGIKSTFWGGRALLNLTAFDIEWKDMQTTVSNPACSCSYLVNAGQAYSRGLELEGSFTPVQGLRLGYNAAYTRSALTRLAPLAPPVLVGYQLPGTPRFAGGLTLDYGWALNSDWRASVGGGLRYVGEEWSGSPSVTGINGISPSYTTADLRAGLSNDRYQLNLFVRNVADKRVYLQQSPEQNPFSGQVVAVLATPAQPRVIGVSIDARF